MKREDGAEGVVVTEVGLDITDPKFWELGFEQAEMYLDEFERIVNK